VSALPEGTVTLLFTDIEGSTRILRALGPRYADVLADHQRLLRESFAAAGGREMDSQGDSFFVVFRRAGDAVRAAIDAQRKLAAHPWPPGGEVRVRMGIHTGEPIVGGDARYVGLGVHRGARIGDAAHGGQVLLSGATRALVEDELPPGVTLRDLGARRLKDLERPEPVFQLVIDGLPSDFPSPRGDTANEEQPVRVVLAEDSALLREGIARLLEDAGFEVVGQVDNAGDLLRRIGYSMPDVAVVDIRMPPTHTDEGLQAAKEIRRRFPDVAVLVLSQYVEPTYATELLSEQAEGAGYLLKDRVSDIDEFTAAVRRVARGGSALDPAVVAQLVGRRRHDDPTETLTPREREVLHQVARGRLNKQIAFDLGISEVTVKLHRGNVMRKMEAASIGELIRTWETLPAPMREAGAKTLA
jgi:DNA-binding NarL/FixJ family response regulator/class 3 adenylate cyclase